MPSINLVQYLKIFNLFQHLAIHYFLFQLNLNTNTEHVNSLNVFQTAIHIFIHSYIHSFIYVFNYSFIRVFTYIIIYFIYLFIYIFIYSFIHSSIQSSIPSFIHLFILSFLIYANDMSDMLLYPFSGSMSQCYLQRSPTSPVQV